MRRMAETDEYALHKGSAQMAAISDEDKFDKELESIRTLNDAELVQFMKADFGSRYAARMALRHPLFTLRQVYHMVKKI